MKNTTIVILFFTLVTTTVRSQNQKDNTDRVDKYLLIEKRLSLAKLVVSIEDLYANYKNEDGWRNAYLIVEEVSLYSYNIKKAKKEILSFPEEYLNKYDVEELSKYFDTMLKDVSEIEYSAQTVIDLENTTLLLDAPLSPAIKNLLETKKKVMTILLVNLDDSTFDTMLDMLMQQEKKANWKESIAYYDNGNILSSGFINEKGNAVGYRKYYYESGNIYTQGMLAFPPALIGEWILYYENGEIAQIGSYTGKRDLDDFAGFVGLLGLDMFYGMKTGEWKFYNENGKLMRIANYLEGKFNGEYKDYYENGKLQLIGKIINDKQTGKWKRYYENGQLGELVNYLKGAENGKQVNYFDNGEIRLVSIWKEGKLMDIIACKDSKGNNLDKGTLKNGNGTVNYYDETGKRAETITYKNGIAQKQ